MRACWAIVCVYVAGFSGGLSRYWVWFVWWRWGEGSRFMFVTSEFCHSGKVQHEFTSSAQNPSYKDSDLNDSSE